MSDFLETIAKTLGKEVKLEPTKEPSPFSIKGSWSMNVDKSISMGYRYQKISDWLPKLIS